MHTFSQLSNFTVNSLFVTKRVNEHMSLKQKRSKFVHIHLGFYFFSFENHTPFEKLHIVKPLKQNFPKNFHTRYVFDINDFQRSHLKANLPDFDRYVHRFYNLKY